MMQAGLTVGHSEQAQCADASDDVSVFGDVGRLDDSEQVHEPTGFEDVVWVLCRLGI